MLLEFTASILGLGLSLSIVLPLALFGAFAAGTWVVLEWMSAKKPRAEERLDEFKDPRLRKERTEGAKRARDGVTKMLEKATPKLAKSLQPKDAKAAGKLASRLAHAGFRSESSPTVFLGLKFIGLVAGLVVGGGTVMLLSHLAGEPFFEQKKLIRCLAISGVMFYVPDLFLFLIAKRRKEQIFLGLPDALDLMVVCVEAGLGLDQAMRKVSEEMKKSYRVIAYEFGLCNLQIQMGKPRGEVLQDLGQRAGVDDLRSLASILIQADKFGSSIAQALRVQSDAMRTRRSQLAEEKAAKTAVKLIFPLVIFIFPGIFVILVGPAAITMVREMFPAMGG